MNPGTDEIPGFNHELNNVMAWQYDQTAVPDPLKYFGLVYLITNMVTGRKYVGKKRVWVLKANKLHKESDWKTYWGSSELVQADIQKYGEAAFTREVLHWCVSPGEMSWRELEELVKRDTMTRKLADGTPEYYNQNVVMTFTQKGVMGYSDPDRRSKWLKSHDNQRKKVTK